MQLTPVHDEHVALGARMIDFFGFHMPVMYSAIIDEVNCVRRRVGLFDLTHMGRIEVDGPERLDFERERQARQHLNEDDAFQRTRLMAP